MNTLGCKLALSKKRTIILLATVTCAILVGSAVWLQTSGVAQAAIINPHPGLVGWWRFDEGIGNAAGDSSGNGNNGTILGATWVAGNFGNALSFQASDASKYVDIPDALSISPTTQVSVSCWLYGTQLANTGYVWKSYYNYVLYSESNGIPRFIVWDTSGNPSSAIASNALPLNSWTNVIGVFGPDNKARIYINGVQSGSTGSAINNS